MSTTATAFDLKTFLRDCVTRNSEAYLKDLNFLTEEQILASPMGCARSAAAFTAECAGFNRFVTFNIRGEEFVPRTDEERAAFTAQFNSKEAINRLFQESVDNLLAAIEASDEDRLNAAASTPWGESYPVWKLTHMCASHIAYHDGQINYIQTLYGDGEGHW